MTDYVIKSDKLGLFEKWQLDDSGARMVPIFTQSVSVALTSEDTTQLTIPLSMLQTTLTTDEAGELSIKDIATL